MTMENGKDHTTIDTDSMHKRLTSPQPHNDDSFKKMKFTDEQATNSLQSLASFASAELNGPTSASLDSDVPVQSVQVEQKRLPSPKAREASPVRSRSTSPVRQTAPLRIPSPTKERLPSPVRAQSLTRPVEVNSLPQESTVAVEVIQQENNEKPEEEGEQQQQSEEQQQSKDQIDPALLALQMSWCKKTLQSMKRHHDALPFLNPVDPVAMGIPQYLDIIKQPMDLSTIGTKLAAHQYHSPDDFIADVRLMLQNCFTFNPPEHGVYKMGQNLDKSLNIAIKKIPQSLQQAQPKALIKTEAYDEERRKSMRRTDDTKHMHTVHKELTKLTNRPFMFPFYQPVDPVALNIPTYFDVIKEPMDLQTMKAKLDKGEYNTFEEYEADFKLMVNNCFTFNRPEDAVYIMGQRASELFDSVKNQRPGSFKQDVLGHSPQQKFKMGKRKSMTGDDSDMDSSDEDDTNNIQVQMIQNQIMFLQSQLAALRGKKGKKSKKRRGSKSHSVGGDVIMGVAQPKAPRPPKVPRPPKKLKKETEVRKITFEEKRQLSEEINLLSGNKLENVIQIIHDGMPQLANQDNEEEIELDIEQLDDLTLTRLWNAVKGKKRRPKAVTTTDPVTAANRIKELGDQLAVMEGRIDKSGKQLGQHNNQSSSEDSDGSDGQESDLE